MSLLLMVAVAGGIALALLLAFLVVRGVVEWVARRKAPREAPLLADQLLKHLAVLKAPQTVGERLDRLFERMVGRSSLGLSPAQGLACVLLAGTVLGGGLYLWREQVVLASLGFGLGVVGLLGFFWVMHRLWARKLQEQLPDGYHLLARSLRAGLTLEQSLALIAAQGEQPLAGEFKRCSEHLELGMTVPAALRMTGERVRLPDFNLFVSMLVIHRQTGGNLALLMDRMAATVRSRNQFRGHVAAVTALGRLSGFFLAIAAPMLMLTYWLIYPEYLARLTDNSQGLSALTMAVVLEVVGVAWLLWLLRVEY